LLFISESESVEVKFKSLWCTFIFLTPKNSHAMGFKSRIFGETLILCVLLILDTRNIVNGCKLFWADGTEVLLDKPYVFVDLEPISDDESPGLLSAFSCQDVPSIDLDQTQVSKYLDYTYNDMELNILLSGTYENWKRNEAENFLTVKVALKLGCSPTVVEFRTEITNFKNRYPPEFPESVYEIELPMPLPAGYTIVGDCGDVIEVTDYDYHIQYRSDVVFSLKDTTEDLEVSALKLVGKKWAVILKTTNTFRIEEPLTITLIAHDVPPAGKTDLERTSEVKIKIAPNITASTPASPLFDMPIYILDIKQEEDIKPVISTLVEGATVEYEVELVYSHGENLEEFFDIDIDGAVITLTPDKSLASTEFSGNFGILILEAKHPGTSRIGKTVIYVKLPGN